MQAVTGKNSGFIGFYKNNNMIRKHLSKKRKIISIECHALKICICNMYMAIGNYIS